LQDVTLVDTTALNFPGFGGYPEASYGRKYNASGSFVYDATTHSVQDWNITAASLPLSNDEGRCLNLPACNHASWSAAEFTLEFAGTFTGDSFTFSHSEGSPASNFSLELDVFKLPDSGTVVPLIYGRGGTVQFGLAEFSSMVTGGSLSGAVVPEPAIGLGIVLGTVLWAGRNGKYSVRFRVATQP
jgi:hypothetical protein